MSSKSNVIIEKIWSEVHEKSNRKFKLSTEDRSALEDIINKLDKGEIRCAYKENNEWKVNLIAKKAVILYVSLSSTFLQGDSTTVGGWHSFYDRIKSKFDGWDAHDFVKHNIRNVPGSIVRRGAYLGKNVVLMPSFVNIGGYVGDGTMLDTWATVGSCAQVGSGCHISGSAGIGGVLEPLGSMPTIVEDNCFIGARSEIVEGVVVEKNSVLGMGVCIGQSTRIIDRATGETIYGRVPSGSVVVRGSFACPNGINVGCAIITKKVDKKTRSKTSINELLRLEDQENIDTLK